MITKNEAEKLSKLARLDSKESNMEKIITFVEVSKKFDEVYTKQKSLLTLSELRRDEIRETDCSDIIKNSKNAENGFFVCKREKSK